MARFKKGQSHQFLLSSLKIAADQFRARRDTNIQYATLLYSFPNMLQGLFYEITRTSSHAPASCHKQVYVHKWTAKMMSVLLSALGQHKNKLILKWPSANNSSIQYLSARPSNTESCLTKGTHCSLMSHFSTSQTEHVSFWAFIWSAQSLPKWTSC